ncbi:MAG: hypothetical protein SOT34_07850 [Candidatus Borkfalkiaceae bacterium]|nr:hypothetical protein [Christensenellaceae bacterium]
MKGCRASVRTGARYPKERKEFAGRKACKLSLPAVIGGVLFRLRRQTEKFFFTGSDQPL